MNIPEELAWRQTQLAAIAAAKAKIEARAAERQAREQAEHEAKKPGRRPRVQQAKSRAAIERAGGGASTDRSGQSDQ